MLKKLERITSLTKEDINSCDILLPAYYKKMFIKHSEAIGINKETESLLLRDDINIEKIIEETNKNLKLLVESTKDAQVAIENQDLVSLKNIHSNIKLMQEKIEYLQTEIYTDYLTKCKNRKWLSDCFLESELFKSRGILVFIDLNDFKTINDTHGHIIGDQVLKYLSFFLRKNVNAELVRYAGDEFILLFDSVDFKSISLSLGGIQRKITQQTFKSNAISNLTFSFSYGLSEFNAGDTFSKVVDSADQHMYKNKKAFKAAQKEELSSK